MRPRILFVDDNEDIRVIVGAMLTTRGYEPATAASCAEGLAMARAGGYDLFLLDYIFTDGTGRELCEQIREFDRDTPILFFSASHPSIQQEAVKCGAQGYVLKPEFELLEDEVARTLRRAA
jgi:CheY-like chemotaxis protein